VIPAGFGALEAQLLAMLLAMIRPSAALLAAPVLGAGPVPVQLRLVIAIALGMPAIANGGVAMPEAGLVSFAGVALVASEALIGLAMGFAVQIGFAAANLGGEALSNTMGLGFAAMNDPATGHASPAIGQYLSMLTTFLFLSTGGHLVFAGIIARSYDALPAGQAWLSGETAGRLAQFGGLVFEAGLAIALPVGAAMVTLQIVLGIISRSAPTLNLFAVGMPAALMAGVVLMAMATPVMAEGLLHAVTLALDHATLIAAGR
jgi:flagellar biosynthesis protein FliR